MNPAEAAARAAKARRLAAAMRPGMAGVRDLGPLDIAAAISDPAVRAEVLTAAGVRGASTLTWWEAGGLLAADLLEEGGEGVSP